MSYPGGERFPHLKILINQKNQDIIYWKILGLKNGLKFSKNIGNLLKFEKKLIQKFENGMTKILRKTDHFFLLKTNKFFLKRTKNGLNKI